MTQIFTKHTKTLRGDFLLWTSRYMGSTGRCVVTPLSKAWLTQACSTTVCEEPKSDLVAIQRHGRVTFSFNLSLSLRARIIYSVHNSPNIRMVNSKEFMVPGESKHVWTMHMTSEWEKLRADGQTDNQIYVKEKVFVCPGFVSHALVHFIQPFKA